MSKKSNRRLKIRISNLALVFLASILLGLASNPIPIKAAMDMLNMASEETRLPLTPLNEGQKTQLRDILIQYGILV